MSNLQIFPISNDCEIESYFGQNSQCGELWAQGSHTDTQMTGGKQFLARIPD